MHTPEYLAGRILVEPRFTLEPFRNIMNRLRNPEARVPAILVGGTNGKGSTLTFLSSILTTAGHTIGTFMSPSMEDFHDMIAINGSPIREEEARPLAEKVLQAAGEDGVTLFELATATAFLYFEARPPALSLIEVGLGGRSDATNVCHPHISILTQVALEHGYVLGDSIEAIAWEKSGIVRADCPVITGLHGSALRVLESFCLAEGAKLEVLEEHFDMIRDRHGSLTFTNAARRIEQLRLGLQGLHQIRNAALAVQAALRLRSLGLDVEEEDIRKGLQEAHLPGRMEWMNAESGLRVLVDGAHNPNGATALARSIIDLNLPAPRLLAIAVYRDKDLMGILKVLLPLMDGLICTRTRQARCLEPEEIARSARSLAGPDLPVEVAPSVETAIRRFQEQPAGTHILCGTLSMVGEARQALHEPSPG